MQQTGLRVISFRKAKSGGNSLENLPTGWMRRQHAEICLSRYARTQFVTGSNSQPTESQWGWLYWTLAVLHGGSKMSQVFRCIPFKLKSQLGSKTAVSLKWLTPPKHQNKDRFGTLKIRRKWGGRQQSTITVSFSANRSWKTGDLRGGAGVQEPSFCWSPLMA